MKRYVSVWFFFSCACGACRQMSVSHCGVHHFLPVLSINEHYHPISGWQLQHLLWRNKQLNEAHSNFACHQGPRHDWLHSLMHKFMKLLHMMEHAQLREVMDNWVAKIGHHLDCVRTFKKRLREVGGGVGGERTSFHHVYSTLSHYRFHCSSQFSLFRSRICETYKKSHSQSCNQKK